MTFLPTWEDLLLNFDEALLSVMKPNLGLFPTSADMYD